MKLYAVVPFILQALAWPITHILLSLRGTLKVTGQENLKGLKGPFIIAANHVNDLDPVLTRAILPMFSKPLFWVSRHRKHYDTHAEEPFRGWRGLLYADWFFRVWGAYPAIKGAGDYAHSLQHHIRIIRDGFSVCIFPQGGKAKYLGRGAPTRGGVAFLSNYTNIPVVPVAIHGTFGINAKQLLFGKKDIRIHILSPVNISEGEIDYGQEAQRIMDVIYSV